MIPILTKVLAGLIQEHIEQEKKAAFESGKAQAKQSFSQRESTLKAQHADSLEMLKICNRNLEERLASANSRIQENVWVLHDQRQIPVIQSDLSIYGPDRFPITTDKEQRMRSEVANAVSKGLVSPPTEDQWKMILSNHPATCVVAGAGSGKSTTLVLRVVFMICHLGIRPREMTVVSFTRASCEELREKMFKVLSIDHWKQQLHPDDAPMLKSISENLVSTFHAALSRMASRQFSGVTWFDVMKEKEVNADQDDQHCNDIDNPIASGRKLTEPQLELLMDAYRKAFFNNEDFRTHVVELIRIDCQRDIMDTSEYKERIGKILEIASKRDLEIVTLINEKWKNTGWDMQGIDPNPYAAFTAEGHTFYANGRIIETNTPIFLSLNGYIDGKALFSDQDLVGGDNDLKKFPVPKAISIRKDIIAKYFGGNKIDLRTTNRLKHIALRIKYLAKTEFEYSEVPRFDVQLSGELSKSDLLEAFYSQASFIENLGMEVPEALSKLTPFKPNSTEYHFTQALAHFWPVFENTLSTQAKPIMTFNRAFLLLGENHPNHPINVPAKILGSFTHLLVDEFQDISPQIVSWLRATQRRLLTMGKSPTLMAIGDDWQSIYGWRGSAPELFIDFGKHFTPSTSLGGHYECRMMENYRSVAPVIIDAEKLLRPVSVKINKAAKAKRATEETDHGVRLVTGIDLVANPQIVVEEIKQQLAFVQSLKRPDKNMVVVLARSQKILASVKSHLGSMPGVSFYTFHGSKGLQGEVAILCEDCSYDAQHHFRNAVYKASGLFSQSYDEAASDEALRLAYVAITRGIRRVVWFLKEPIGAAKLLESPPLS